MARYLEKIEKRRAGERIGELEIGVYVELFCLANCRRVRSQRNAGDGVIGRVENVSGSVFPSEFSQF